MPLKLSKTTTKIFLNCPCGYQCSSVTESKLQLLFKLHSKKCEISAQQKFNNIESSHHKVVHKDKDSEAEMNALNKKSVI